MAGQIARAAAVDPNAFQRVRHEVLTASVPWVAEYSEYQSGDWWTASLWGESRDPSDVLIRDCDPVPTRLLDVLPRTRELLDGLGLRMMWVRLARLGSNSFLWEHVDYDELASTERYRLHIPIATNRSAYLVLGNSRVYLAPGHIWRLTPTIEHGACNLYGPDRIHLIADCYANDAYERLTESADIAESDLEALPPLSSFEREEHLTKAANLLRLGYQRAAEHHLLRLFHGYAMEPGTTYDLVIRMYESTGASAEAAAWQAKKAKVLGTQR